MVTAQSENEITCRFWLFEARSIDQFHNFSTSSSMYTLLGCQSEWPKDKPFLLINSRHARNLYNSKIIFFLNLVDAFWDNSIYPILSTKISTWMEPEALWFTNSNEYIWSKFFWFSCMGWKVCQMYSFDVVNNSPL